MAKSRIYVELSTFDNLKNLKVKMYKFSKKSGVFASGYELNLTEEDFNFYFQLVVVKLTAQIGLRRLKYFS